MEKIPFYEGYNVFGKGVMTMKSWYYQLLTALSALAGWAAINAVHSTCSLVLYEPEMPEEVERLV